MGRPPIAQFRVTAWPGYPVAPPAVPVQDVEVAGEWIRFVKGGPHADPMYVEVPDEIRLRELADVDTADIEALAEFTRTFGRLTPQVNLLADMGDMPAMQYEQLVLDTAHKNGRRGPERRLEQRPSPMPEYMAAAGIDPWPHDRSCRPGLMVHADDLAVRIRILRQLTAHAIAYARGEYEHKVWPNAKDDHDAWSHFTELANGALQPFHVRVYIDTGTADFDIGSPRPSLFSVAVLQLINDLSDEAEYHVCPAETCGRIFIRSRGATVKAFNRTKGVTYCTPGCANAQRQREFRRKKRNEGGGS